MDIKSRDFLSNDSSPQIPKITKYNPKRNITTNTIIKEPMDKKISSKYWFR